VVARACASTVAAPANAIAKAATIGFRTLPSTRFIVGSSRAFSTCDCNIIKRLVTYRAWKQSRNGITGRIPVGFACEVGQGGRFGEMMSDTIARGNLAFSASPTHRGGIRLPLSHCELGRKPSPPSGLGRLLSTERLRARQVRSVAPHDIYICGLVCAVMAGNRYGLRGALLHIWPCGRRDGRRKSMDRIPRDIICVRVMDIAGCWWRWWRSIHVGFAIPWPV
jgi:hypothetical protein